MTLLHHITPSDCSFDSVQLSGIHMTPYCSLSAALTRLFLGKINSRSLVARSILLSLLFHCHVLHNLSRAGSLNMRLIFLLSPCVYVLQPCFGGPDSSPCKVWPKYATNQKSNVAIHNQLKAWLINETAIMVSQIGNNLSSVNFWSVTLARDQAIQLRASDHVSHPGMFDADKP